MPCTRRLQPLDRRDEFEGHLTAALDVLSPAEQHRLMTALCQPSADACVDALWALCTTSAVDDCEHAADVMCSRWQQPHGGDCWGSSQCRHTDVPMGYMQPEAVDTTTETSFCVEAKSMASWRQAGFHAQPPHAGFQYASHDHLPGAENEPGASQKRSRVPTKRLLGSELGCDFKCFESDDMIAKQRKKPVKGYSKPSIKPPTKPPAHVAHADKAETSHKVATTTIRQEVPSKSSMRDRIWGLLTEAEQSKLSIEQMSAAEGTSPCL